MSPSVELLCVDPKRVREVWPHVSHLIRRAVSRTNLCHTRDIEDEVLDGVGLLWVVWDGLSFVCAATTLLIETDNSKVCLITACGGEDMNRWLPLFPKIEAYAKAEGCSCVRIYGRKGWLRVLEGYTTKHVILERPL